MVMPEQLKRRQSAFLLVALSWVFPIQIAPAQDTAREALEEAEEQAFREVAVRVAPSLVRIDTVGGLDIVGRVLTGTASTTGVVIGADGYIVSSAFNFISKPASVLVTLPDKRRFPARIIATDRLRMVTLLKISATDLTVPPIAPKDSLRVGQWALALGRTYDSPLPSVSVGIVSALDRVWGKAIQTDAKVSPVNYGGALVDVSGRATGLLVPLSPQGNSETAGVEWYDSGIGFAVPFEDILSVLPRLKEGTDLRPGLTGVVIKAGDLYAEQPKIDRVRFDSPAWKAGFKPGDTVEKINGQPIIRVVQLLQELKSRLEGETVEITVRRDDELITRQVTLVGELKPYELPFLGILPTRHDDPSASGVGIRYVYEGSAAAESGLKKGDRILSISGTGTGVGTELTSAAQLAELITQLRPDETASLSVQRGDSTESVDVTLTGVVNTVPAELTAALIPAAAAPAEAEDAPKTGRYTDKLTGYEQEYWAFVPDSYRPDMTWSLLVWIHPQGTTMEATMYREWQSICEHRGIILIGPKAAKTRGWEANEAEFVTDLVKDFRERYTIAPERIAIHSFGNSGPFAASVAFGAEGVFRGVALAGSPLRKAPPEHTPEFLVQFHLVYGERDPVLPFIDRTVKSLEALKFPVTTRRIPDHANRYPTSEAIEEIGRWIDSLDRI
jgi:serine protease Do